MSSDDHHHHQNTNTNNAIIITIINKMKIKKTNMKPNPMLTEDEQEAASIHARKCLRRAQHDRD